MNRIYHQVYEYDGDDERWRPVGRPHRLESFAKASRDRVLTKITPECRPFARVVIAEVRLPILENENG